MRAVDCCSTCGCTACLCPLATAEVTIHSVLALLNFTLCFATDDNTRCAVLNFHRESALLLSNTYVDYYNHEHLRRKTFNTALHYSSEHCCRLFCSFTELTAICALGVADTCYTNPNEDNLSMKISKKVQDKYGVKENTSLLNPTRTSPGIQYEYQASSRSFHAL